MCKRLTSLGTCFVLLFPSAGIAGFQDDLAKLTTELKGKNMTKIALVVAELPAQGAADVLALDFSADGKVLAVRLVNDIVEIWDWRQKKLVRTLTMAVGANDHRKNSSIVFSPDGRWLATCHSRSTDNIVTRIWDTTNWIVANEIRDAGFGSGCNALRFSPDSKTMIRILDRLPHIEGETFVSYETTHWQRIWGMRTVPFYTHALAIQPSGRFVAIKGNVINPKQWPFAGLAPTFGTPALPDSSLIAVVNLETQQIAKSIITVGLSDTSGRIAWSNDGALLASANGEALQIFETATWREKAQFPSTLGSMATSLVFTPDGRYLIQGIAHRDKASGHLYIRDARSGETVSKENVNVVSMAITADSKYLATGSNGKISIWQFN